MSAEDRTTQLQQWLDRLQAGDPAAREHLLQSAVDRLRRLSRKMLRDYPRLQRWEETDDVFQNAAVRLWRALQEVSPPTVRDFLRLAALQIRRELIDLAHHYYGPQGLGARHATDAGGGSEGGAPAHEPSDSSHEPSRLLFWTEFHQQVDSLPEEEREVFDLLWYQELSQVEAAALLGVSDREVRRRWRSARQRLRKALPGELPHE